MAGWALFAHDADVGVRGFGPTREAAFEQGALALMHAMGASGVAPQQVVSIACEAPNDEILFVDWLNALIFEMATRSMLFSRFRVGIEEGRLRAEAWGDLRDCGVRVVGHGLEKAIYCCANCAARKGAERLKDRA